MHLSFEIISALLAMSFFMALLWVFQIYKGEADIVDAGWACGLGLVALYYAASLPGDPLRRSLVGAMACAWAARLTAYLIKDRVLVKGEDGRYISLRQKWGKKAGFNFFLFFQAQGILVVILATPFFIAAGNMSPINGIWTVIAILFFSVSLAGESLADWQLVRFKSVPANKGKTCRQGLWKYSRHPNYFFEWLHWWAYVFLAVGSPLFAWSIISPVIMLFLILKVSGLPPAEKQALESRGEDYRKYQRETSAFIPWFSKEAGQ